MKDEMKEQESLLEDFKKLGLKNKRLKDELKGRKGNPSKKIKLIENTQRELEEAQKQREEQRELTKYWKEQTKELRGKMGKDKCGKTSTRRIWESNPRKLQN